MDTEEEATDAVAIGFATLPDDVLVNVFSYHVSDYSTLTRLERACSRFRRVINAEENDSVLWDLKKISYHDEDLEEIPENYKAQGLKTGKQVTRRLFAIAKVTREQRNVGNIFVEELELGGLKDLFNEIVQSRYFDGATGLFYNPDHLDNDFEAQGNYEYTNQAIYGVAELIQDNIIAFINEEILYRLPCSNVPNSYHEQMLDLKGRFCDRGLLWIPSLGSFDESRLPQLLWDGSMENTQHWERNKIVRRLVYRAGLPELPAIDPYASIWKSICMIALQFLYPVCVHNDAHRHQEQDDSDDRVSCALPITMEDIQFHASENKNLSLPFTRLYVDNQESDVEEDSTYDDDDETDEDFSVYSDDEIDPGHTDSDDEEDSIDDDDDEIDPGHIDSDVEEDSIDDEDEMDEDYSVYSDDEMDLDHSYSDDSVESWGEEMETGPSNGCPDGGGAAIDHYFQKSVFAVFSVALILLWIKDYIFVPLHKL